MTENDQRLAQAVYKVEGMSSDIAEIKVAMKDLAAAVGRLAVVEERQSQDRAEIARLFKRQDQLDDRMVALERQQPIQQQTTKIVDKVIWAIVSAVLAAVVSAAVVRSNYEVHKGDVPQLSMPAR